MPMARAFGLRGEAIGNDQARVRMQHNTDYTNSRGDVHGGAIATLLDCALSCAARSHDPARYGVVTVDLTVHFIAPGRGDVIGLGFCERRGRALSFVRGEVRDEAGELLALATGTFAGRARRLTAAPGRPANPSAASRNSQHECCTRCFRRHARRACRHPRGRPVAHPGRPVLRADPRPRRRRAQDRTAAGRRHPYLGPRSRMAWRLTTSASTATSA